MSEKKDELITGSELARRIKVDPSYINNVKRKAKLKDAKCMRGKKFYFRKSCEFLGKDPDDPHKSRQSNLQTDIKAETKEVIDTPKPKKEITTKPKDENNSENEDSNSDDEAKSLLEQILKATKDGNNSVNRNQLDLLRQKAGVLREYFTAKNEEIKNRKLEENLFDRDELIRILSFTVNAVTNSLINMPNNYAVSLEGMSKKEINDFVTDDTNKILEDLRDVGNKLK